MVLVALLLAFAAWAWWRRRRRLRRAAIARLFDEAVSSAGTPAAKIAAMSEQLRRASRRIDPDADRLEGDDWLRFLDRGLPHLPLVPRLVEAAPLGVQVGFAGIELAGLFYEQPLVQQPVQRRPPPRLAGPR